MTAEAANRLRAVYGATSNRELADLYDDWAASYDADLRIWGYTYPPVVAGLVGRYVRDLGAPILDAGAGTGLIGACLATLGYHQLVGIDLSPGLLAVAGAKGVYARLLEQVLGSPLDFPSDHFAAAPAAGVLTVGHAPPASLDELVRVTRPGGQVIFTLTDAALADGGCQAKLDALDSAGRWRRLERTRPWHALPGAPAEATLAARGYVYEII